VIPHVHDSVNAMNSAGRYEGVRGHSRKEANDGGISKETGVVGIERGGRAAV
jgi:hypothetical protein